MGEAIYTVHRVAHRRRYGAVLPAVSTASQPPDQFHNFRLPDIAVDDEGNAVATWLRDAFHTMPPGDGRTTTSSRRPDSTPRPPTWPR